MGLKISNFKKAGQTYTDAYARVSNVQYDNITKIAIFGIDVYVSKEDGNKITTLPPLYCKIEAGTDSVAQCYKKITTAITQLHEKINELEATTEQILNDDNQKLSNEHTLHRLKNSELLQLKGAAEW